MCSLYANLIIHPWDAMIAARTSALMTGSLDVLAILSSMKFFHSVTNDYIAGVPTAQAQNLLLLLVQNASAYSRDAFSGSPLGVQVTKPIHDSSIERAAAKEREGAKNRACARASARPGGRPLETSVWVGKQEAVMMAGSRVWGQAQY
jgi:hypothetical protein